MLAEDFEEVLFTASKDSFFLKAIEDKENRTFFTTSMEIAKLFNVAKPRVVKTINEMFDAGELDKRKTTRKISQNDEIVELYSLEILITVSYKLSTEEAVRFRKVFSSIVERFVVDGYILNNDNLKSNMKFADDYFEDLLEVINEIRISKREVYQKITDIFANCSYDYDNQSETAKDFYLKVLEKLDYVTDDDKSERNYLYHSEIKILENIVDNYIDYAEYMANSRILMSMNDWIDKLESFLDYNEYDLLNDKEKMDITRYKVTSCLESF